MQDLPTLDERVSLSAGNKVVGNDCAMHQRSRDLKWRRRVRQSGQVNMKIVVAFAENRIKEKLTDANIFCLSPE